MPFIFSNASRTLRSCNRFVGWKGSIWILRRASSRNLPTRAILGCPSFHHREELLQTFVKHSHWDAESIPTGEIERIKKAEAKTYEVYCQLTTGAALTGWTSTCREPLLVAWGNPWSAVQRSTKKGNVYKTERKSLWVCRSNASCHTRRRVIDYKLSF